MDLVLTIVFYLFGILAVAGAFAAGLAPEAPRRRLGLVAVAVGTAGMLVGLSA